MDKLKNLIEKALAPTIVVTLIFFLNYYFFGMDNTMIAPFATLSFLRFRNISNHYECMLKTFCIYIVMTLLAYFALMSLPLCIAVNAVALFWLAYWLIDEYNPTNYFPAGMALIFFQIAPARTPALLLTRIEALCASFLIIFAFIIILSLRKSAKNPLYDYIRDGLANCRQQLAAFEIHDNTKLEILHQELCVVNKLISDEIYSYNRASIRLAAKVNWYCRYVALFQVINFFTLGYLKDKDLEEMKQLLERFCSQFENGAPSPDYKRLNFRNNKPDIQAFRFRFALRLTLIVTPCLVFGFVTDFENRYWLVISVFFMMIPVYENTRQRVRQRFFGTCIGIVICFFLFSIFRQFPGRVALMTLANFMIYGSSGYGAAVVYITCSALAIQTIQAAVGTILLERLLYTGLGALIALAANKLIFPIRTRKEMFILIRRLDDIRDQMKALTVEKYPDDNERRYQKDQLLIKSYLLMKRLQTYHDSLPEEEQMDDTFLDYEKKHFAFLSGFLKEKLLDAV